MSGSLDVAVGVCVHFSLKVWRPVFLGVGGGFISAAESGVICCND